MKAFVSVYEIAAEDNGFQILKSENRIGVGQLTVISESRRWQQRSSRFSSCQRGTASNNNNTQLVTIFYVNENIKNMNKLT